MRRRPPKPFDPYKLVRSILRAQARQGVAWEDAWGLAQRCAWAIPRCGEGRSGGGEEFLEARRAGVPRSDPNNARRSPVLLQQGDEIAVFGSDDGVGDVSCLEDCAVGCVSEAEVPDGGGLDPERLRQPGCQGGRQLGVQPEDHAARMG